MWLSHSRVGWRAGCLLANKDDDREAIARHLPGLSRNHEASEPGAGARAGTPRDRDFRPVAVRAILPWGSRIPAAPAPTRAKRGFAAVPHPRWAAVRPRAAPSGRPELRLRSEQGRLPASLCLATQSNFLLAPHSTTGLLAGDPGRA